MNYFTNGAPYKTAPTDDTQQNSPYDMYQQPQQTSQQLTGTAAGGGVGPN